MDEREKFIWFDEVNFLNKKLDALAEMVKLLIQKVNELEQSE